MYGGFNIRVSEPGESYIGAVSSIFLLSLFLVSSLRICKKCATSGLKDVTQFYFLRDGMGTEKGNTHVGGRGVEKEAKNTRHA